MAEKMKQELQRRYVKARVKIYKNTVIINTGMAATVQGIKKCSIRGLGRKNRELMKDVIVLRGYHAYEEEFGEEDEEEKNR